MWVPSEVLHSRMRSRTDGLLRELARRDLKGRQCLWWVTETAEDISPYATFQLSEGGGGGLAGLGALGGLGGAEASAAGLHPNNTLLHSFMYHEHAMTEGCASPPPAATVFNESSISPSNHFRPLLRYHELANWNECCYVEYNCYK